MAERFGVELTDGDLRTAVQAIHQGKAKHIRTQSKRVTVWELTILEHLVWVTYNNITKEISTVMRPHEEESILDLLKAPE
jgi:hypothetical protein